MLYTAILYWCSGLRGDEHGSKYGLFLLCFFIVRSTGIAFAEFFAGIAPSGEAAISAISSSITIFQCMSSLLVGSPFNNARDTYA